MNALETPSRAVAPPGLLVFDAVGIDLNTDRTRHRIPDAAVFRTEDFDEPHFTSPPVLAVEVISRAWDTHTKRRECAEFGIPDHWIVSPFREKSGITELRLRDGVYHEYAEIYGSDIFSIDAPFPFTCIPQWLVRLDGDWRTHMAVLTRSDPRFEELPRPPGDGRRRHDRIVEIRCRAVREGRPATGLPSRAHRRLTMP